MCRKPSTWPGTWAARVDASSATRRRWKMPDKFGMALREPAGVVGLITPWNFPVAVPSWKLFPALVAGNTVILKPAEDAPATAAMFVQVCVEAGLPPGVLNLVCGRGRDRRGADCTPGCARHFIHWLDGRPACRYMSGRRVWARKCRWRWVARTPSLCWKTQIWSWLRRPSPGAPLAPAASAVRRPAVSSCSERCIRNWLKR